MEFTHLLKGTYIMTALIVYNKFDLTTVMAAAILQTELKSDAICLDYHNIDYNDRLKYSQAVFIGVPEKWKSGMCTRINNKEAVVHFGVMNRMTKGIREYFSKRKTPDSLIKSLCEFYGIDYGKYKTLDMKISNFYKPTTSLYDVVTVYKNLMMALSTIRKNTEYYVGIPSSQDTEEYHKVVALVKDQMREKVSAGSVVLDDRYLTVLQSHYNDESWYIALRIMLFSHKYYVNSSTSTNGTVIYSNIPGVERYIRESNKSYVLAA